MASTLSISPFIRGTLIVTQWAGWASISPLWGYKGKLLIMLVFLVSTQHPEVYG